MNTNMTLNSFLALAGSSLLAISSAHAATIVGFEAESGTYINGPGPFDGWRLETDANALGGQSIYARYQNFNAPTLPANADAVVSYTVSFDTTGTYDLYARMSMTNNGSDTFYADTSFDGAQNSWDQSSNLGQSTGDPLNPAGSGYVWVNMSDENIATFTVAAPGTVQFNIAARERDLRFDSFAFGTTADRATITDAQLSAAVVPEPSSTALLGLGGLALILRRRR